MMNMFLKKRLAAKKNKKKGFTLIEVIVVIVIIAILAAIAVPSLTRYIGSAGLRADMATGHNIQVVLQAELSDQFVSRKLVDVLGNGNLDSKFTAQPEPDVKYVLNANGIILPAGSLSAVGWTAATAKLNSFVYATDTSVVAYNGSRLFQLPITGNTSTGWTNKTTAITAAEAWVKATDSNTVDPVRS